MYRKEFEFHRPLSRNSKSLSEVLAHQNIAARKEVEQRIHEVLDSHSDENTFINRIVDKYSIEVPQLKLDEIKREPPTYENVANLNGFFPGSQIRMFIAEFGIPYSGEIDCLRYIPQTGADMSTPTFTYDNTCMWFKIQTPDTPNKDVQQLKNDKDKRISFLQKRVEAATPEIQAFNQQLPSSVQTTFNNLKEKYQKDKDILDDL